MSVSYTHILWNPFKKRYDRIILLFLVLYITGFMVVSKLLYPGLILPTIIIRTFGTLAILLLHLVLAIGPLTRLNRRFLPLLYNRRHLGVTMFLMASVHAIFSLIWFHGFSDYDPVYSVFTANTHYNSLIFFPFQVLGFCAYLIFMLMAFTSHDFWLNFLSPRVWKGLHMMVYLAYALVIMHVALGIIQYEDSPVLFGLLLTGLLTILSLHIAAGWKEFRFDLQKNRTDDSGWVYVCTHEEIEPECAKMVNIRGERIAVFKYDGKLSAVHNVCKHQNGPLGEGKIIDGCITCPWHGYQYLPANGRAPAPFTETLATYQLKLRGNRIYANPKALPEGTEIEPVLIPDMERPPKPDRDFFVGWLGVLPQSYKPVIRKFVPSFFLVGLLAITLISFNSKKIRMSSYNYDQVAEYQGELRASPFPMLRTLQRDEYGNPQVVLYPLVKEGKHGVDADLARLFKGRESQSVAGATIKGRIISRDGQVAMELAGVDDNIILSDEMPAIPLLDFTVRNDTILTGQIIDPKCYLGVMNPGEGKPHRECAINCIRGGIPPAFITEDSPEKKYYILVGEEGQKINQHVLFAVGEPVQLSGKVLKIDNWNMVYLNPAGGIVRLALK